MLAEVFCHHTQIQDLSWSKDAELDAGQVLSGYRSVEIDTSRRQCLQTTYLNEQYVEYLKHEGNFKLIWLVRNPHSVVYSMLYNWARFALNEVFLNCGLEFAPEEIKASFDRWGHIGVRRIDKAALAFVGKAKQAEFLVEHLSPESICFVNYDSLVNSPRTTLERLFEFVGIEDQTERCSRIINNDSVHKADKLSKLENRRVVELCQPEFEKLVQRVD